MRQAVTGATVYGNMATVFVVSHFLIIEYSLEKSGIQLFPYYLWKGSMMYSGASEEWTLWGRHSVLWREVVLFWRLKNTTITSLVPRNVSIVERLSLFRRVLYRRFHCIPSWRQWMVNHLPTLLGHTWFLFYNHSTGYISGHPRQCCYTPCSRGGRPNWSSGW